MKAKNALILFAVMLALASAAAIGIIIPENYPMPEAVQPQASNVAPVAPQAPVPVAPQPGHPGGIYTQFLVTCYGPIRLADEPNAIKPNGDVLGHGHISKDNLTGSVDFACDTRETAHVLVNVTSNSEDVKTLYITVSTQPGVEVNVAPYNKTTTEVKHVTPGVWVANIKNNSTANLEFYIYGQPISSGYRYVTVTITQM
jgi:hypothetical protein